MLRISAWTPKNCSNERKARRDGGASRRAQDRGQVDVGQKRQGGTRDKQDVMSARGLLRHIITHALYNHPSIEDILSMST